MKKNIFLCVLTLSSIWFTASISFLPIALDTPHDNDPYYITHSQKKSDYVDKFTATTIFSDVLQNTWGFEKDACREFVVVDSVKKDGTSSLYMSWDNSKKGCDWIGGAFAWNNWQSVDMTTIIDSWAIRFWVRTKSGSMRNLPIAMSFLDESDKASETVSMSSKFFEGSEITEEWKEVIVSLSYFRCKSKGLNISGITQIILSFSDKAQIYFDEFQFVDIAKLEHYKPKATTIADTYSSNSDFTQTDIFTDMMHGGTWGMENDACRNFSVVDDVAKNGSSSLLLSWNNEKGDCGWIGAGFAWNNWRTIDMSSVIDTWGLRFWVRTKEGELDNVPLVFNFIDGDDLSTNTVAVSNKFFEGNKISTQWKEVVIPLTYFGFKAKGLDLTRINQLIVAFQGSNSIYIDDLQFIELKNVQGFNTPFTATSVFSDTLVNAWGFLSDDCRTLVVVDSVKYTGTSSLFLQWNTTIQYCDVISVGFAWNDYNQVQATQIIDTYALNFWIRTKQGEATEIPLGICFSDNSGVTSEIITISKKHYDENTLSETWQKVSIPLRDFKMEEQNLNLFEVSQLVFHLQQQGSVFIDEITFSPIK